MKLNTKVLLLLAIMDCFYVNGIAQDGVTVETKKFVMNVGERLNLDTIAYSYSYNSTNMQNYDIIGLEWFNTDNIPQDIAFFSESATKSSSANGTLHSYSYEGKPFILAVGPGKVCLSNMLSHSKSEPRKKYTRYEITIKSPSEKPHSMILQKQLHMQIGSTHTLTPIFYPEGTSSNVTWFSTNPNVVTVEGGQLTAKAMGETTITCITENGLREDCNVVVTPVLATGINLNKNILHLSEGKQFQLIPTITPEENTLKQVSWKSLNTDIVTVDNNGNATCVGKGWTVVVAETIDGSDLTAGCIVQVGNGLEGDLNYDQLIDVEDVNMLVNIILKLI